MRRSADCSRPSRRSARTARASSRTSPALMYVARVGGGWGACLSRPLPSLTLMLSQVFVACLDGAASGAVSGCLSGCSSNTACTPSTMSVLNDALAPGYRSACLAKRSQKNGVSLAHACKIGLQNAALVRPRGMCAFLNRSTSPRVRFFISPPLHTPPPHTGPLQHSEDVLGGGERGFRWRRKHAHTGSHP